MCSTGDCFIVLKPNCAEESIIFGRNADDAESLGVAQEVHFYEASAASEGQCDGGASPDAADDVSYCLILQKPHPGCWGGDAGANERNVAIGIVWHTAETESEGEHLYASDLLRLALASAESSSSAVERIGALLQKHGADNANFTFVICDAVAAWLFASRGKLWAAQCFTEGFLHFPNNELTLPNKAQKSSEQLEDALKTLGVWNGEGDLNFATCFGGAADVKTAAAWCGVEPIGDASYTLTSMFATLRAAAQTKSSRSSTVSLLNAASISCHWFTATPDARESVFKPFIFAPNPKISPLTKVPAAGEGIGITLLHKLHTQRKPAAVEDLKALEAACVEEINKYLSEHPTADAELDELMKDCVEAEVKFYR